MATVAVFDSGLGSLSVIRAIQRRGGSRIIYLADQRSYPYGLKSRGDLEYIVKSTIRALRDRFSPDVIVVASNTPGLLLDIRGRGVVCIRPPLGEALAASATKNIGILATRSAAGSGELARYAARWESRGARFVPVDCSRLVDLVESGAFLEDGEHCIRVIRRALSGIIRENSIDAVTLSSTHLPLLGPLLAEALPGVALVDPAESIADRVCSMAPRSPRGSLRAYTTGSPARMQRMLARMGMKTRVSPFT